jgi:hypothetical protein
MPTSTILETLTRITFTHLFTADVAELRVMEMHPEGVE